MTFLIDFRDFLDAQFTKQNESTVFCATLALYNMHTCI
jgi:hypothetical protein